MVFRVLFAWVAGLVFSVAAMAQTPAVGTAFRECTDCPEMVVLPAGSFTMGSPGHEAGRDEDEGPQRVVTVARPFALGRYEVTRGQFAAFVAASGYQSQGGNCWYWNGDEGKFKNDDASLSWRNPGYAQNDGHPVVCVSWTDAKAYVDWLASRTGKAYRLPGEAEWEYAARAASNTARPWGDDPNQACSHANVADQTFVRVVPVPEGKKWVNQHECDDGSAYTANVGSYRANRFGLYDMIGNVWEWTADCWNTSYTAAPSDGSVACRIAPARVRGRRGTFRPIARGPGPQRPGLPARGFYPLTLCLLFWPPQARRFFLRKGGPACKQPQQTERPVPAARRSKRCTASCSG